MNAIAPRTLIAAHRRLSIQRTIDASTVAAAIVHLLESGSTFNCTVGDLLNRHRPDHEATDYWPRSPRGLGDALRRQSPALAHIGIKAEVESRSGVRGFVRCDIARLHVERLFHPRAQGNEINNVNNVSGQPAPVDVVDADSRHPPAKKALRQHGNIVDTVEEVEL